jgi:hypothetical protein
MKMGSKMFWCVIEWLSMLGALVCIYLDNIGEGIIAALILSWIAVFACGGAIFTPEEKFEEKP